MSVKVFGITGTNGKTTVSYMLRKILEEAGRNCAIIGTIKHEVGDKRFNAVNTTPSKELLKTYFEEMEKQNIDVCVMEVSSHGLRQGRVDATDIHFAGFTNLTQDHLDYHKDMEDYFSAKTKLFYMAKQGVCINIDDKYGERLFRQLCSDKKSGKLDKSLKLCSISLKDEKANFYGNVLKNSIDGVVMEIRQEGGYWGTAEIRIPGITAAYNGLLAGGLASMFFESPGINGREYENLNETICRALSKLKGVPGRFEKAENEKGYKVIVDFAHTPDALENLLRTARQLECGRILCVFGCGGNRDAEKRSIMGRIAGENADFCIITSDNPRFEEPYAIMEDIEKGMLETSCGYIMEEDREEAIKKAVDMYEKGDLIIIAGKGHEKYQIIKSARIPFDDVEITKKIIKMKE
ncbi:MAG: UDP-N-acetylmuramoyl-L-alanyl-D-glutamate--2,6-diaminopimelate ligase [Anaerovoracaceae bacterium]